jgi:hypothetical protein
MQKIAARNELENGNSFRKFTSPFGNKKAGDLTVLIEVRWARRLQAPMPQIREIYLQENHTIDSCKSSQVTPECFSVSLFPYLKSRRQFKALRSTIWFFCDACHKLEVDIILLSA